VLLEETEECLPFVGIQVLILLDLADQVGAREREFSEGWKQRFDADAEGSRDQVDSFEGKALMPRFKLRN